MKFIKEQCGTLIGRQMVRLNMMKKVVREGEKDEKKQGHEYVCVT